MWVQCDHEMCEGGESEKGSGGVGISKVCVEFSKILQRIVSRSLVGCVHSHTVRTYISICTILYHSLYSKHRQDTLHMYIHMYYIGGYSWVCVVGDSLQAI